MAEEKDIHVYTHTRTQCRYCPSQAIHSTPLHSLPGCLHSTTTTTIHSLTHWPTDWARLVPAAVQRLHPLTPSTHTHTHSRKNQNVDPQTHIQCSTISHNTTHKINECSTQFAWRGENVLEYLLNVLAASINNTVQCNPKWNCTTTYTINL